MIHVYFYQKNYCFKIEKKNVLFRDLNKCSKFIVHFKFVHNFCFMKPFCCPYTRYTKFLADVVVEVLNSLKRRSRSISF